MPYADPEKQKAAKRAYYKARYEKDEEFRQAEKERAAKVYAADPEKVIARVIEARKRRLIGK